MKKIIIVLLLLASPVAASQNGFFESQRLESAKEGTRTSSTITGGTAITNTPMPKCETGWTLVMVAPNVVKCAHDIKDPQ